MEYSDNAISVYKKLYFTKDETVPADTHERVANAIADNSEFKEEIKKALNEKAIRPNSPVLINAGSATPQFAACFVGNLEDSLSSIFEANKEAGLIYSKGSGLGLNYGMLREKGAELSSEGQSSGACSFLYMLAATAECVKSGGRSRRCLPKDTMVNIPNGITPIQDIKIGDLVNTSCGYFPVSNVFDQGVQLTYIFETDLGIFECTPNHKTAIYDDTNPNKYKFILAKDITLSDKLIKLNDEFELAYIHTIRTGRMVQTYDIEVESAHEFIANGFLTHNSAHMAMFTDDHPDIEEFITIKNGQDKRLRSMNLSIAVTDKFMTAVEKDEDWNLIGVKDKQIKKTLKAKDLFNKIVDNAYNTGDPALWFQSRVNEDNCFYPDKTILSPNPCFKGNTLIPTKNGAFPIQELVDKEVEVYDGQDWVKCNNFRKTGENQEILKIKLYDGSYLEVTPYHTMYLEDGTKIEAKDLKINDRLEFKDIQYNGNIEEKAAYVKGFMCADGHIHNKKQESHLLIYEPKIKCINKIKSSFSEMPINSKNTNTISEINAVPVSKRKCYNLTGITAREDGSLLKWCSVYKEKMPTEIYQWNYKSKCDFIAGLFDGDGNIMNNKNGFGYQLTSIHKEFLIDVLNLLKSIGVYGKISLMKKAEIREMPGGIYQCQSVWRLTISQKYSIFLSKQVKFERLMSFADRTTAYNVKTKFNMIVDIIKDKQLHDVYCCTLPITHKVLTSLGIITGQCGEQSLLPYGSCNLIAINLNNCIINNQFDFDKLKYYTRICTRFTDNVIDLSMYPTNNYKNASEQTRNVGIGIMALADVLIKLGIPYDSKEGIKLAGEIIRNITKESIIMSSELALEKGTFPLYDQYKDNLLKIAGKFFDFHNPIEEKEFQKVYANGLRNSQWTTIQPTGSVAISADCSAGSEPLFAIAYEKHISDSDDIWYFVNQEFENRYKDKPWYKEALKQISKEKGSCQNLPYLSDEEKAIFKTAHDIKWQDRLDMQEALQKGCSNSLSVTINLPKGTSKETISQIYMTAWKKRLKGLTVFVDGSLDEQPIYFGSKEKEETKCECRFPEVFKKELLDLERSERHRCSWRNSNMYINISLDDDNNPIEMFAKLPTTAGINGNGLFNPTVYMERQSNWDLISRLISMALRYSIPLEDVINQCDKSKISMVDAAGILSRILKKYIKEPEEEIEEESLGKLCPECGKYGLIAEGGCLHCFLCNYSKCG